jgi:hypothetical protein
MACRSEGVFCALLIEKEVMKSSVPIGVPSTTMPSGVMGMDNWSRLAGMGVVVEWG